MAKAKPITPGEGLDVGSMPMLLYTCRLSPHKPTAESTAAAASEEKVAIVVNPALVVSVRRTAGETEGEYALHFRTSDNVGGMLVLHDIAEPPVPFNLLQGDLL